MNTKPAGLLRTDDQLVAKTATYLFNPQQTRETDIQVHSGIRIRDPSNRAATDLRLSPRGRRKLTHWTYWTCSLLKKKRTKCV